MNSLPRLRLYSGTRNGVHKIPAAPRSPKQPKVVFPGSRVPVSTGKKNVYRTPADPGPKPLVAPKPPTASPQAAQVPAAVGGFQIPKNLPAWAQEQLRAMDTQALSNQTYARLVNSQLASQLAPVQNAMNAGESQYRQSLANATALAGQAAQFNPQIQGMAGGVAQDPLGYARQANATANQAIAGYDEASRGARSIDRVTGLGNLSQGLLAGAAYNAQQLPLVYTKNRNDYIAKIDQWKAEQDAQTYNDTLKFAASQGTNLTRQQIAQLQADTSVGNTNANNAARAAIAQGNIDSREAIAAANLTGKSAAKPVVSGGYRGLTAPQYAKARNDMGPKVDEWLRKTDKEGYAVYDRGQVFDLAVSKGLRPSDALAALLKHYPTIDASDQGEFLSMLKRYLPEKNARAVLKKLMVGRTTGGNKASRDLAGLGS